MPIKTFLPVIPIAAGLFLIAGSSGHAVLVVGLPDPDSSPQATAFRERQVSIAFPLLLLGLSALLFGVVAGISGSSSNRTKGTETYKTVGRAGRIIKELK